MSSAGTSLASSRYPDDEDLVSRCLKGDEEAWAALTDKYKNLVFSIPLKLGFKREDATEIFQSVCLTLLREVSQLKAPRALPAWLIQTTAHKCIRWEREQRRYTAVSSEWDAPDEKQVLPEKVIQELERELAVRAAVNELSAECKRLVNLLFYSNPPIPYEEAAKILGLAKGSIGATRMRCLEKLRRSLERRHIR
jgi:RNA polymerase sigma factor (sigma-70 family)